MSIYDYKDYENLINILAEKYKNNIANLSKDDLKQEAIIAFIQHSPLYDGRGDFSVFIFKRMRWHLIKEFYQKNLIKLPRHTKTIEFSFSELKENDVLMNEEHYESFFLKEEILQNLKILTSIEKQIIFWKYGLLDGKVYTINEIAEYTNFSVSKVEKLIVTILKKLKKNWK